MDEQAKQDCCERKKGFWWNLISALIEFWAKFSLWSFFWHNQAFWRWSPWNRWSPLSPTRGLIAVGKNQSLHSATAQPPHHLLCLLVWSLSYLNEHRKCDQPPLPRGLLHGVASGWFCGSLKAEVAGVQRCLGTEASCPQSLARRQGAVEPPCPPISTVLGFSRPWHQVGLFLCWGGYLPEGRK